MRKFCFRSIAFYSFLYLFFLLLNQSFAQIPRSTSFDDRPVCEESKGMWREFGNSCVDDCEAKFDKFAVCARDITFSCDCGKGRCWNEKSCFDLAEYKKIFDAKQEEERKLLEQQKKKRQKAAKQNNNEIMKRLAQKYTSDSQANVSENINNQISNYTNAKDGDKNSAPKNNYATILKDKIPQDKSQNVNTDSLTNISNFDFSQNNQKSNSQIPVISQSTVEDNPPVPAMFLQQEQAKQAYNQKQNQALDTANKNTKPQTPEQQGITILPTLPVVPLPN